MNRSYFTSRGALGIAWSILLILVTFGFAFADPPGAGTQTPNQWWIYLTIVVLFIIFGGVIWFMFILQRGYLKSCDSEHQILVYAKSPAGLPEGTIRAMISFVIIAISLYLCVLLFFKIVGEGSKFPEALSSLLGAVVGFYFGSRSNKGDGGAALKDQISTMAKSRDGENSDTMLSKINKGIVMSKAVIDLLPEEQKKKYGGFVEKLETGYQTVSAIAQGGNVKDALEKGQALFNLIRTDNPVRDIFSKALKSFGPVLGGSVPALAVIATVVGCGVKLVGTAYEKWKKRILNVPITPAVLPLQVVDANTGFTLLLQSPIFKKVFEKQLEANDRPFMTEAVKLLGDQDVETFWNKHKGAFDSRAEFDQGLQEFRRAALDRELEDETKDDPALFQQAGGLQNFMQSVDQINTNEQAQAALHQLAMAVEMLQKKGEPVPAIFEKIKKEEGV